MTAPPADPNVHARRKRAQLGEYVERELVPHECVRAVIAIGSVAAGNARPDSDIDAVVLMDPLDVYVAPAEAIWRPRDNSYHSIFDDDPALVVEGIQLDLHRLDLRTWQAADFEWPEHTRAELWGGWVVLDRVPDVEQLIRAKAGMTEQERTSVLDEVLVEVGGLLPDRVESWWGAVEPAVAFDRLEAAWEALARGLFACNWRWRPWRSRSSQGLLQLDYRPETLSSELLTCVQSPDASFAGYTRRLDVLRGLFDELLEQLTTEGSYGAEPVSEAFRRLHDEPGRAWNLDDWNRRHRARLSSDVTSRPR